MLVIFAAILAVCPISAQTLDPIRYDVSFPAPHTHYVEIDALYPAAGRSQIDLMMAVWTPGSYLVREYARHVEGLQAWSGEGGRLTLEKTRKNRWRVETGGAQTVRVRYRVYAHEMSVRTNWVDEEFALLNGAPTFITLAEAPSRRPHEVRLTLPRAWSRSFSGMRAGEADNTYVAPDYDALVDSPIVAGTPAVYQFDVAGTPHYLVNFRERGVWNGPQAVQDLARAARATAAFWAQVPFDRYYFFNIIGAPRNALEHRNSTVINIPRESTGTRDAYLDWLSTAVHEYFHAWNVKRLRPIELGPFDYENEVYTRHLWFAEGLSDYYADLLLARAGVTSREEYLGALSNTIRRLQTTPGRLEQSVELASYDAWIKYYRADENTDNTAISYYVKGAVIGFLLDARIRALTAGAKSLDDLMRLMYARFSGDRGFTGEDLRNAIVEVAGPANDAAMRTWAASALETTAELEYGDALDWYGLRMTPPSGAPRPWLGVVARNDGGRTIVSGIRRGSPAAVAGLSLGDEIVAVDGAAVEPGQLFQRLGAYQPGARVTLTIARGDARRTLDVVLTADPAHGYELMPLPSPSPEGTARLAAWLEPR